MSSSTTASAPSNALPDGYVPKRDGSVAPTDLIWDPDAEAFEAATEDPSVLGRPVTEVADVATPAYWVTYDETTGIVWGVGQSPEESIQAAKFEAYGDEHGGIGYEFACWCEDLSTAVCSETLYERANDDDRLSLSDGSLQEHVMDK